MIDRLAHSMMALQRLMRAQEVTANNLANLNTPGFKADKVYFHSMMQQQGNRMAEGVIHRQTIDMSQGHFESTGNPFDLAIEGDGFFKVELDGVELLTRNGRFHQNTNGFLVNEQGASLIGSGGPVNLPLMQNVATAESEVQLEISADGRILFNGREHVRIELFAADRLEALERHSSGYFFAPEEAGLQRDTNSGIMQGFFEAGNVNPLTEMVEMMRNATLFEAQQKAMTTTDELLSKATNTLGRF